MKEYSQSENLPEEFDFLVEEGGRNYQDLEERGFLNAKKVRDFVKKIDQSIWNKEYIKQVVRSSGSVGANYIEANEFLGEKDFLMKVRISRREAKETKYWIRLLDIEDKEELETERQSIIQESDELKRIFSAIIINRTKNQK